MFCDSERKNFGLKQENFFFRIAKTTIEGSVGTFSGIFEYFLLVFHFSAGPSKLAFQVSKWSFWRICLWFLFHHFWSLSRKSVAFSRKTLAMLLYLCFASPKRYFDENFFFIEKLFSRTLLDKGQIYTGFLAKTFRQCCQNFILSVHRKFSGNKKVWKKNPFFSVILGQGAKKNFRPVAKLFRQGCQNCNLLVQRNSLGRFLSFEKTKNFWMFRDNEWKTIGVWQEIFFAAGMSKLQSKFL